MAELDSFSFGDSAELANELLELVLAGKKSATCWSAREGDKGVVVGKRWFVKDAAALWHGLPKPPVTRTDAVRWLREYFRIPKLDGRAKRFARRVAAKEARIAARQKRKSKR